jgi:SsrA-binding protein
MAKQGAGGERKGGATPTLGNPKARWKYEILEKLECGIALAGPEVKSLREGRASIEEAYARFRGGELFLVGMRVEEYRASGYAKPDPARARKLLAHRHELTRLRTEAERKGLTMVPLRVYWSDRGIAKVEIALAKGRKLHDKRQADRTKSAKRDMDRAMRRR